MLTTEPLQLHGKISHNKWYIHDIQSTRLQKNSIQQWKNRQQYIHYITKEYSITHRPKIYEDYMIAGTLVTNPN